MSAASTPTTGQAAPKFPPYMHELIYRAAELLQAHFPAAAPVMHCEHVPAECALAVFEDKQGIRRTTLVIDFSVEAPAPRHEDRWVEIDSAGRQTLSPAARLALLSSGQPLGIGVVPLGAIIAHGPGGDVLRLGGVPNKALDVVDGAAHRPAGC